MEGGPYVALETAAIYDMDSFHAASRRALGFPESYAATMEAWVECMLSLRSGDGNVGITLPAGEMLELELSDVAGLVERVPDLPEDLAIAVAAVNRTFMDNGQAPAIALIFT